MGESMAPDTIYGLLGEIARIAQDYDLRERIDEHEDSYFDSFMWRDCIEAADSYYRTFCPATQSTGDKQ